MADLFNCFVLFFFLIVNNQIAMAIIYTQDKRKRRAMNTSVFHVTTFPFTANGLHHTSLHYNFYATFISFSEIK